MMIITSNGPQSIGNIKRDFERGKLFLSPDDYQTEGRWKLPQKKLLIDTVFRRLDIPKFYLWKIDYATLNEGYPEGETKNKYKKILEKKLIENEDTNAFVYEVVDGQQRIRTILEYMGVENKPIYATRGDWFDPFSCFEDTPISKNKLFSQLNDDQQDDFEATALTVMVLENANIKEIREMFLRLQNGTPLNSQQKRDAMGSNIGKIARELSELPFFTKTVPFDNSFSAYRLVSSQMINLEIKEKLISCTSRQLDKLYDLYKNSQLDKSIINKAKKVLIILGNIFPEQNPNINRSYALSLYWIISRIIEFYSIPDDQLAIIKNNFLELDMNRLSARNRDYSKGVEDDIYEDLSISMSSGTDGADAIISRHDIITQYLFKDINIIPLPTLDPKRIFTYEEKLILFRKANGLCELECNGQKCGRELNFDEAVIDHIVPHSKLGKTEISNGRLAYNLCNIARGNRDEFDHSTMCHKIIVDNVVSY